ncbi:hypothetical protein EJP82_27490 [Paenibacillus anaericanus]|uniref:Uncharacterized protein n=1 Tax=Paenibacillus anaericanus TaxID=170367 RepID=A0A3S1BBX3_9BACL|nr:hypothetical protein EJP82_27490 [Paenibacillus anaericanus]
MTDEKRRLEDRVKWITSTITQGNRTANYRHLSITECSQWMTIPYNGLDKLLQRSLELKGLLLDYIDFLFL